LELKNLKAAWHEAACAAREILKDLDGSLDPEGEWRTDVTNDRNQPLFSLGLIPDTYMGEKLR
jgi:hypothetical protein